MTICLKEVQFNHSVVSNCLWLHGQQHTRPPCPFPIPGVYSNSCPSSWWCHPVISSSVIPFSSCLQSFPASGSFPLSQFFTSGGQSIRKKDTGPLNKSLGSHLAGERGPCNYWGSEGRGGKVEQKWAPLSASLWSEATVSGQSIDHIDL